MTLWIMKTIHHWFGVVFAAFFFVIALSGVWVTLDKYIWHSFSHSEFRDEIRVYDGAQSAPLIQNILDTFPSDDVAVLKFPHRHKAVFTVYLASGEAVYLDQNNLNIIGKVPSRYQNGLAVRIHKNLLNPGGVGHAIVIWTGLIGTFLAILGVMIFIPQWRGFRKDRWLYPQKLTFRDVRRTHMSSGIIFSLCVAFFSLSGWALGEPKEAAAILSSFDGEAVSTTALPVIQLGSLPEMVAASAALLPGQGLTHIVVNAEHKGRVSLGLTPGMPSGFGGQSIVEFVPETGEVTRLTDSAHVGAGTKILGNMWSWHTGEGRSVIYKIIISAMGCVLAMISLTGLLSYILKWRKTLSRYQSRRRSQRTGKETKR